MGSLHHGVVAGHIPEIIFTGFIAESFFRRGLALRLLLTVFNSRGKNGHAFVLPLPVIFQFTVSPFQFEFLITHIFGGIVIKIPLRPCCLIRLGNRALINGFPSVLFVKNPVLFLLSLKFFFLPDVLDDLVNETKQFRFTQRSKTLNAVFQDKGFPFCDQPVKVSGFCTDQVIILIRRIEHGNGTVVIDLCVDIIRHDVIEVSQGQIGTGFLVGIFCAVLH